MSCRRLPSPPRPPLEEILREAEAPASMAGRRSDNKVFLDMISELWHGVSLEQGASDEALLAAVEKWQRDRSDWPDSTVRNLALFREVYTRPDEGLLFVHTIRVALRRHLEQATRPSLPAEEIAAIVDELTSDQGIAKAERRQELQQAAEPEGERTGYSLIDFGWMQQKMMKDLLVPEGENAGIPYHGY